MGHIDPKTRQEKTNGPNGAKRNTEQATSLNRQKTSNSTEFQKVLQ